jgi:hypothetical protein
MVLKCVTKNGMRIHEPPPYTQAEDDEFYRRIGRNQSSAAGCLVRAISGH